MTPVTAPMPAPAGPSFPPAPLAAPRPSGRHRSSAGLTWSVLAAVTAILLVAVAIVLWRNGALPSAAGTETAGASDAAASGDDASPPSTGDDGSTTTVDPGVPLPDLPGTDGGALPGTDGGAVPPPETGTGDLGLSVPISQPACDGTWVVFLGSSTDPASYASSIEALLAQYPGSSYLLTAGSCASLRQAYTDGSQIYAVYSGTYASQDEACAARAQFGNPAAYVKVLDDTTPPDQIWTC